MNMPSNPAGGEGGTDITVRLTAATAAAAVVALGAFAGTAAAAPPNTSNANGCVGAIISSFAHIYTNDDTVKGGLGAEAKALGVNVGESIQAAATAACGKHQ